MTLIVIVQISVVLSQGRVSFSEISGMCTVDSGRTFIVLEDSGNPPCLYQLDRRGQLLDSFCFFQLKNSDWEALAYGRDGTLFIVDGGGNNHNRRSVCLYKMMIKNGLSSKMEIKYKEQFEIEIIEHGGQTFWDFEAAYYADGNLFLVSKNWYKLFGDGAFIFKVSFKDQKAHMVRKLKLCTGFFFDCQITDATTDLKQEKLALLSYDRIMVVELKQGLPANNSLTEYLLSPYSQKEAITFGRDGEIWFASESQKWLWQSARLSMLKEKQK